MPECLAPQKLMTKVETCMFLQISSATLDRWIREKKVSPIRIGKVVRFTPEMFLHSEKA
jgi:predicted site-specific integrase-resolvase